METTEVDGLRIAYDRVGSGPPLLLLHGYVGDGPTTWRPQLEALSGAYTVIAWDAPGAGRSSDPPESFGIAGYADCLAGFIKNVGVRGPHIAGLSFGGALALEFCRRCPGVPSKLILVSAYAGWRGSLPLDVAERRLQQALALADLSPDEFVDTLLPTMFADGTPPDVVAEFDIAMRAFHPSGFRAMARAAAEDLRDVPAQVKVPTLLVSGDADERAPKWVAEALHAAIDGSLQVVLPGVGHVCNIEAPVAFNRAVHAFLDS
jgi:pimeloyl-ACP methyl ester carboxylesterase